MDLFATLDRWAHRTRLDVLTPYGERKARSLRWLPVPFLAGIPLGCAMFVAGAEGGAGIGMSTAGAILFFTCLLAANLMRLFGPRITYAQGAPLDERERSIRARAGNLSGAILIWAAILACFYAAYASVFGAWMPRQAAEWVYLGFGLQGWWLLLPVLIASWLQPRPPAEE
ncbi:MAG: hypothetical protein E6G94_02700 [Alphaproteobacteria bacterium]|nr:MAG: hypothetical protein E6G94_02700 [Alphaproteobacteria bacterium]